MILGHTTFPLSTYLFWFHVPMFFILSGILFNVKNDFKKIMKKRIISLWIPYFVIGLLSLIIYSILVSSFEPMNMIKGLYSLFYGGIKLNSVLGAFWYLPVLFFSELIVHIYIRNFGYRNKSLFLFATLNYIFFHYINTYTNLIMNINIIPIAIFYLLVGIFIKQNISYLKIFSVTILLITLIFIFLVFYFEVPLEIDLKYGISEPFVFDIVIPTVISISIFSVFIMFSDMLKIKMNVLLFLGQNSLILMLIHNLFIHVLIFYGIESWQIAFIVSLVLSSLTCIPLKKLLHFTSSCMSVKLNS